MITTLVTIKGGAGRSTLALNLAVAAAKAGQTTLLIDADSQRALVHAVERRGHLPSEDLQNFDFADTFDLRRVRELRLSYETIIIDTPGHDHEMLWKIVAHSDIALVPIADGYQDLEAALATADRLDIVRRANPALRAHCLLNRYDQQTPIGAALTRNQEALLQRLQATSHNRIPNRTDLASAFMYGLGIQEFDPTSEASSDISAILQELHWIAR